MGMLSVGNVKVKCEGNVITKQSFRDQCDINKIIANYKRTGLVKHVALRPGIYSDVSNLPDYQKSLDIVRYADSLFMSLPAVIRKRFDNNPGKFVEFVRDPANVEEGVKLGIFVKRKEKDKEDIKNGDVHSDSKDKLGGDSGPVGSVGSESGGKEGLKK